MELARSKFRIEIYACQCVCMHVCFSPPLKSSTQAYDVYAMHACYDAATETKLQMHVKHVRVGMFKVGQWDKWDDTKF